VAAMSLNLMKALASALFLSTSVLGLVVQTDGHFEISAQPKGIDVSGHQGNVNWGTVMNNGVSFAYIKATEGTSKVVVRSKCGVLTFYFQPIRALTSPLNTLALPKPASFVVATTLPFLIGHLVLPRPTGLPPTVGVGVVMESPSQAPSILNVRIINPQLPRPTN